MASLLNQYSLISKQHFIKHTSSLKNPVQDVLDSGAIDSPKLATTRTFKRGEVPWRMTRTEFVSLSQFRYRYITDILLQQQVMSVQNVLGYFQDKAFASIYCRKTSVYQIGHYLRSFPPSVKVLFQNLQIDTNIKRQLIIFYSNISFRCHVYLSCCV